MRSNVAILLKYILAWLLVFFFQRLVFILYLHNHFIEVKVKTFIQIFFYSLRLDLSCIGYLSIFIVVLICINNYAHQKQFSKIVKIYSFFFVVITSIIQIIDINIYAAWGSKIDYKVFEILFSSPTEAIATATSAPVLLSLCLFVLMVGVGTIVFCFFNFTPSLTKHFYIKTTSSLFIIGTNFLLIRGSFGLVPVNVSAVYFSENRIANHAAINTPWILIKSCLDHSSNSQDNPYAYFATKNETLFHTQDLRNNTADTNSFLKIFSKTNPNVCLIVLEGFSSDFIESLGGKKNITPFIDSLAHHSLLFENIYASGDRTYKALPAILSAQPALGTKNIIEENNKQELLPSLPQSLYKNNYYNYFLYGGDINFNNIYAYLLDHQIVHIDDLKTLRTLQSQGKWGISDDQTLNYFSKKLSSIPEPFFATYLSLSNHEPFNIPKTSKFGDANNYFKMLSTAYFTDSCLGDFFNKTKDLPFFANTVFVIVADHGTATIGDYKNHYDYRKFKIPLMFFSPTMNKKFIDKRITTIGNQTDLVATILKQLKLSSKDFFWSKDLMSTHAPNITHFVFDDGIGIISKTDTLIFDANANQILFQSKNCSPDFILKAKAFLQINYERYLSQ